MNDSAVCLPHANHETVRLRNGASILLAEVGACCSSALSERPRTPVIQGLRQMSLPSGAGVSLGAGRQMSPKSKGQETDCLRPRNLDRRWGLGLHLSSTCQQEQFYSEYVLLGVALGGMLIEIVGVFPSQWCAYKLNFN